MSDAQIKVEADKLSDLQLIDLAKSYKKALEDNAAVFTDGAPYIAAIAPMITKAEGAVQAIKDHKQAGALLQFTKKGDISALRNEVKRGGKYVSLKANGSPVVMTQGGFGVRDAASPPEMLAPENFHASFGSQSGSIDLQWNPVSNAVAYLVHYRVANQNGPWVKSNPITDSQFRLTGLVPGELYELSVCTVFSSDHGNSPVCDTIEHRAA